jgi:uncharacterized protein (TIGR02594 family)
MDRIIDVSQNVTASAEDIRKAGVGTVIRYYGQTKAKRVQPTEAAALAAAGLSLAVVYEDNGGSGGKIADFTAARGQADAARAAQYAAAIAQPKGSAIYFGVDWDFVKPSDLVAIRAYFTAAKAEIAGRWRIGAYGSGLVTLMLREAGLAEYLWLAQSTGWTGYHKALSSGHVTVIQKGEKPWPGSDFKYDEDVIGPGFTDIGAFVPGSAPAPVASAASTALYAVNARSGLNLRRGAGTQYDVLCTLPEGTLVHGASQSGDWLLVDVEGDGRTDGYLSVPFLKLVAGGLPEAPRTGLSAYQIARQELARDVREIPGKRDNPQIVTYHTSTMGGPAHDEVAWCSSFVNWCVRESGLHGTDSKWARSWHEDRWGNDVTNAPQEGDIVVFRRKGAGQDGGHVGFLVADEGQNLRILGGNQGNRVSVGPYPKNGVLGPFTYTLLSIRRA